MLLPCVLPQKWSDTEVSLGLWLPCLRMTWEWYIGKEIDNYPILILYPEHTHRCTHTLAPFHLSGFILCCLCPSYSSTDQLFSSFSEHCHHHPTLGLLYLLSWIFVIPPLLPLPPFLHDLRYSYMTGALSLLLSWYTQLSPPRDTSLTLNVSKTLFTTCSTISFIGLRFLGICPKKPSVTHQVHSKS